MARIQFRLPDGNKRRSFLKTERVAGLYAYVESLVRILIGVWVWGCVHGDV